MSTRMVRIGWVTLLLACNGEVVEPKVTDADQDGFKVPDDCDDQDPEVFPGAVERCDGVDSDCDGELAPGEGDVNGDGELDCVRCGEAGLWDAYRVVTDRAVLRGVVEDTLQTLSCDYNQVTYFMFLRLDNVENQVECVYTGRQTTVIGEKPDPNDDMNTEHTWPQSEGAGSEPAKCDLHHLYPADVEANARRGNHPFGVVTGNVMWDEGGSRLGADPSGNQVFEPRVAHRGNVARSMLYFSLRYGYALPSSQVELFLTWNEEDPVDVAEWERTVSISEYQEAGVNPLVACPDLVDRVWLGGD